LDDEGRFKVTGDILDKYKFRVPTLRNIAITAPYFHNGKVKTLSEAIRVMAPTQLHKQITDEQVADIEAFLNGLTGAFPEITLPRLPLVSGRSIVSANVK
jgi:cytochrome c peroxidase